MPTKAMSDAKDMAMGKKRSMAVNKGSMSAKMRNKGSAKYVTNEGNRATKMSARNPNAKDINRESPEVTMPATTNRQHAADGRLWDHSD